MEWAQHWKLKGQHAFLSASNYHWLNYDDEKLDLVYTNMLKKERGTRLHALAHEHIELGVRMPRTRNAFDMYVNDAIGFGMQTEQVLYYSDNAFGTADAICFKKNVLRIHDLKTGDRPVSKHQLRVYDAFFCLEYGYKPDQIDHELRVYQFHGDPDIDIPDPEDIYYIMDKIIAFDKRIDKLKIGV